MPKHGRFTLFPLLAAAALMAGCSESAARCFAPDTVLPQRAATLADPRLGQSARDLAEALFDRDLPRATRLLDRDPALAKVGFGAHFDMLVVALSTCDHQAVDLLLAKGAAPDGVTPGIPLVYALRAEAPWFAERLLRAGAAATPARDATGPINTAIALNSLDGVRMLLDFHADPNVAERTGNRPLHTALDMERFRIAELLLDRGGDPWAIDVGGANLATSTHTPMLTADAAEAAAQRRLASRVTKLGWPDPAPSPREIRVLALAGKWPPAAARAKGAAAVPARVLETIRPNTAPGAKPQP
ncbi:ankyrin repeat domain-containing protein [Sphingomonas sp. RB3P16]|uniref:ankyrin repeat domain-containing protein n=1 Tax=Parasphingomonas frigoris TaxID=3096163 RepID=UPI002FC8A5BB